MREYQGNFEIHLTAEAGGPGSLDRFAGWCRDRGMKCARIVLDRGRTTEHPMATWRRSDATLPGVAAEAHRFALETSASGLAVSRVKVEADPRNDGVPAADADAAAHPLGNYFEHHVKLLRDAGSPRGKLLAACEAHAAHLSRNAFRDGGRVEERFVTLRCHRVGRTAAEARLGRLLAALHALGETVAESESEYCVYDTNLRLDAGWLPGDPA